MINQIPTTTTLTASASSAVYGAPTVFTASSVETATGKPAQGYVVFSAQLTYAQVYTDGVGQASWTNGNGGYLPVGSDTVKAQFYSIGSEGADQTSTGSVVETVTAAGVTPAPTFQPAAGTYTSPQTGMISDTAGGALIYYTTDGSTPIVGTSAQYAPGSSIPINASETIRAIAMAPGYSQSAVSSAAYVINLPQPNFSIALNPVALSLTSGSSGTTSVIVTPVNNFVQIVSFSCSGLPAGATCSFSPSTVQSQGTTTLTLTLPATSGMNRNLQSFPLAPLSCLVLGLGSLALWQRRYRPVLIVLLLSLALPMLTACGSAGGGGGQSTPPPPAQIAVTVQGTSGSLSNSALLNVTVN